MAVIGAVPSAHPAALNVWFLDRLAG